MLTFLRRNNFILIEEVMILLYNRIWTVCLPSNAIFGIFALIAYSIKSKAGLAFAWNRDCYTVETIIVWRYSANKYNNKNTLRYYIDSTCILLTTTTTSRTNTMKRFSFFCSLSLYITLQQHECKIYAQTHANLNRLNCISNLYTNTIHGGNSRLQGQSWKNTHTHTDTIHAGELNGWIELERETAQ